jgi:CheY-like chemotaxis protein
MFGAKGTLAPVVLFHDTVFGLMVVLVVDDEITMLRTTEAVLIRGGYSPTAASGPMEALQKSRDFQGDIDLLLTDVRMPQMDGFTLARKVLQERPHLRILLMSADPNLDTPLPLLKKPFHMEELLEKVAEVIEGPPPLPADVFAKKVPLTA